jgi:hypothetical protein
MRIRCHAPYLVIRAEMTKHHRNSLRLWSYMLRLHAYPVFKVSHIPMITILALSEFI